MDHTESELNTWLSSILLVCQTSSFFSSGMPRYFHLPVKFSQQMTCLCVRCHLSWKAHEKPVAIIWQRTRTTRQSWCENLFLLHSLRWDICCSIRNWCGADRAHCLACICWFHIWTACLICCPLVVMLASKQRRISFSEPLVPSKVSPQAYGYTWDYSNRAFIISTCLEVL